MADSSYRPLVVGIGEILWDMLPQGRQLGGAPANFVWHAGALGAEAVPVSCVGDDEAGREIIRRLRGMGVCCDYVFVDPRHPTGTVDVSLDAQGAPTFLIHENVAWDFIPFVPALKTLAARADAVCFGTLAQRRQTSRRTISAFVAETRPDCLKVFDINLRQSFYSGQTVLDSLRAADVLKLNDHELPVLMSMCGLNGDADHALEALREKYDLRAVALTRGAAGSLLSVAGHDTLDHPGYQVQVADSVGAGDAFAAALTVGLLRGLPPERISDAANRLAAYVCSQTGATPAVPDELRAMFAPPDKAAISRRQ